MASSQQVVKFLPETVLPTIVIKNQTQLNSLGKAFETLRIVWGFFNFRGRPGRLSKCLHIILNIKDSIVVIDLLAFPEEREAWKLLKDKFFENSDLEKVFFAPEVIADYLWHQHSVKMINFTSLKVLHDSIGKKQFPLLENVSISERHLNLEKTLVKFLDHYLASMDMIHPLELTILLTDFTAKPPYPNECVKARKKQLALQVKYLPQLHSVMKKLAMKGIRDYIECQLSLE